MSLNMYQVSVPMFISMLNNLSRILIKAERYAEKRRLTQLFLLTLDLLLTCIQYPGKFRLVQTWLEKELPGSQM